MKKRYTDIVSIIMASIALVISVLTWLDMRDQVRLFKGQIKSYVQILEAKLLNPISDAEFIEVQLKLKNLGQTAAINVRGDMDYKVGMPNHEGQGNQATLCQWGSMGPGLERTVVIRSNRRNMLRHDPPLGRHTTIYFYGTISFTDDTTHESRKEDWCYELPLRTEADLKRTDIIPSSLSYVSNG